MHSKERLQLIVAHEHSLHTDKHPEYLPSLQRALLEAISRYININTENVNVRVENKGSVEVFEITVDLPENNG